MTENNENSNKESGDDTRVANGDKELETLKDAGSVKENSGMWTEDQLLKQESMKKISGIKGFFEKLKQKKEALDGSEDFPDPAEPNLAFYHYFRIMYEMSWVWIFVIIGTIFSALSGTLPIAFYFMLGELLDSLATPSGMADLDTLRKNVADTSMYMAFIALGALVANFAAQFSLNLSSEAFANRLKRSYFLSLTEQEIAYFDYKKTGTLLSKFEDISKIKDGFTVKIANFAQYLTQFIFGIVMAFLSSWKMTLVMLATAPIMAFILTIGGGLMKAFTKKLSDANATAVSTATEVLSSMRTVRSMAGESKEQRRFTRNLSSNSILNFANAVSTGIGHGTIHGIIWGSCSLAFWYGGQLVADPEEPTTIGDMMKVFGLMLFSVMGLGQMLAQSPDIAKAFGASTVILKVLYRNPQIPYKNGITPDDLYGNISFENVSFSYPTRPDIEVLKNFNLEIEKGKQIALVGSSGSGKSTILGLVERFYDPLSGTIKIDGTNIKDIDPQWLHKNVGIVTQEPVLFNTTIKNNIIYAVDRPVTEEEIVAAAQAANCHDFIKGLPDGYNTIVGERGTSLSGGQKQRVAIARSVIQNPKILLLDEATSALDTESEKLVQDALNKLMKGRTCIMIAHRLSTVKDVDLLVVMKHGEIVETGSHYELLKNKDSAYYSLAQKQMMFAQEEQEDFKNELQGTAPTPEEPNQEESIPTLDSNSLVLDVKKSE